MISQVLCFIATSPYWVTIRNHRQTAGSWGRIQVQRFYYRSPAGLVPLSSGQRCYKSITGWQPDKERRGVYSFYVTSTALTEEERRRDAFPDNYLLTTTHGRNSKRFAC
ncbi:hypothetical protein GCM10023185_16060 [Hymenobacter saemangeumensis]|uniref:Uncharacterized protein n=1 Tax=Hymenobacter saemangeumensis TaxID=1084522 RepID=A0ABP8I9Q7_9BACT